MELHILEIKSSSRAKIAVDGATGTSPLQNLEIVTIRGNNLGDTITEKTFTGLVQVRILDLSRNRITSIGPNSFDAIAKTLNMLNLRHNRLRKLVGDIFASVFLQADMMLLQISLEYNWWHCDCDLQPMQNILRQYPTTFTGFARCDTPIPLRNSPIQHVKLCDHNNHTTTTSSTTETISSSTAITTTDPPATTTTKPPKDQLITLKCMKYFIQNFRTYVSVGLQKQDKVIRLRKTFDKDHSVIIKDFPEDYILLWYEKASQSNQGVNHNSVNCFLNTNRSRTHNINMGSSWRKNKVHTFCMKPKNSLTMTPLNCVSFDTLEKPDFSAKMWMPKSFRFTAIVLMIVASILAVLMGIGIVVLLARKYPTLFDSCSRSKRNKCDNNDNDEQVSRKSSCQSKRIDRLYTSQGGCTDSRGSQESQFDYIIWQVEQQRISSISRTLSEKSVPPPLPPPHPNQLKRRSQLVKSKDGNDIYCELHWIGQYAPYIPGNPYLSKLNNFHIYCSSHTNTIMHFPFPRNIRPSLLNKCLSTQVTTQSLFQFSLRIESDIIMR